MIRQRHDSGLTLIELLIAMAVMAIITTPLVTAFVLTLTTTARSAQDVSNSADLQLLSSYFDVDVANADTVSTTSSCGGGTSFLAMTWLDGATQHSVAYGTTADAAAKKALGAAGSVYTVTRYDCTNAAAVRTNVLARNASTVPAPLCDASACTKGAKPGTVTLLLSLYQRPTTDPLVTATLVGTRRVTA